MMTVITLFLAFFMGGQTAEVKSKVDFVNGQSIGRITYVFPDGSSDRSIMYKTTQDSEWMIKVIGSKVGVESLPDLQQNSFYIYKLRWLDGEEELFTSDFYFRTYALIDSEEAGFKTNKMLVPSKSRGNTIHPLYQGVLGFSFKDKYLADDHLLVEIYDEESLVIYRMAIPKNITTSSYYVDLERLNVSWELDHVYSFKIFDKRNPSGWIDVRLEELITEVFPEIAIEPLAVNCDMVGESASIQYLGSISGGRAPFEVSWSVMTAEDNKLLQGPVTSEFVHSDEIVTLIVEYPLPYKVVLSVFDGCGLFGETSMIITCDANEEGDNTVFIENLGNDSNSTNNQNSGSF